MAAFIAFVKLSRLKFLTGGFLGVAFGSLIARQAGHTIDWRAYALAQLVVTSFQLMTHYTNDYFDREADALSVRTAFSGGSGVFARSELPAYVALVAASVCLALGLAGAAAFLTEGNRMAFAVSIAIAVLAWSYSSPPLRLLALGLGEVTTAVVVGMLVPLLACAASGAITALSILSTLPVASSMFVMMIGVQIPDITADSATGKRNLLVRFGLGSARALIAGGTVALAGSAALAVLWGAPRTLILAAAIGVGLCAVLQRRLHSNGGTVDGEWVARTGVTIFVVTLAACTAAFAVRL